MNIILTAAARTLILNVSDVIRQTAPAKGDAVRAAVSGRQVISLGCWRTECDRDAVAALLEGARGLTAFTDETIAKALAALA